MQSRALPTPQVAISADRWIPSWPIVIGLAVLVWTLAEPAKLLLDPDTYLHLAAGRWILAHRALPFADPFSNSMPGAPWVPHEWLAEVALATAYRAGGWGGVSLVAAASLAVSIAAFLRLLLRYIEPFSALIITVPAAALMMPHALARPHILAMPLLVIWCGALFAAREEGRAPPLRLLPVMALWANLHGGFMFGLALAGFLAGEAVLLPAPGTRWSRAARWGGFTAAAALMALCTPNWVAGFLQPFRIVTMPALQSAVFEWQPPDIGHDPVLEIWLLGSLLGGFAFGFRLAPTRLLLVLGLFHETFHHLRHEDLLAVAAPLAAAPGLGRQIAAKLRATPRSALWRGVERLARPAAAPAMLAALVPIIAIAAVAEMRPIDRAGDFSTPAAALAAARAMGLSGPVFNSYRFGGYLVFEGVPTFIDGRVEMYGDAFLARYVKARNGDRKALVGILDRYHIGWTLLVPQQGAVAVLDRLPGWCRVYGDRQAIVFRRSRPFAARCADGGARPEGRGVKG